jgi:DNA adenine methylase
MIQKPLDPVIKWSGSKRTQAHIIVPLVPPSGVYYEPFVGGGSILGNVGPRRSFASDVIPELIDLWNAIKTEPEFLKAQYASMWEDLQTNGHEAYYRVREIFNTSRTPEHFLFLTRTCVNGLIRFNSEGNFNNSLHHSRPGIHPSKLGVIIDLWSERISNTSFHCAEFTEIISTAKKNDIVYLDPPYMNNRGRYRREVFDFDTLWAELESLNKKSVKWILSIDGSSGSKDYSNGLSAPRQLSRSEIRVAVGHSPFPRLQNSRQDQVFESIFTNFDAK